MGLWFFSGLDGFVVFQWTGWFCGVLVDRTVLWCFSGLYGFVVFQWTRWFCGVSVDWVVLWCFSGPDGFVVFPWTEWFYGVLVDLMGKESWLLCLICLSGASWWLSGSSSRCHGVVCGLWLWYFLIILTYYFWWFCGVSVDWMVVLCLSGLDGIVVFKWSELFCCVSVY